VTTSALATPQHSDTSPAHVAPRAGLRLGSYAQPDSGASREVVSLAAADGSFLVIDRLAGTQADRRLVAHLAADEPAENAALVCALYLADESRGRCRGVAVEDLHRGPFAENTLDAAEDEWLHVLLRDVDGFAYRIRRIAPGGSFPQLRWTRSLHAGSDEPFEPVRLRDVVARLQDYEPACSVAANAIARHRHDRTLATHCLRAELQRLAASPIVLNRRLRELVQQKTASGELTMSEIAIRCGRLKRDQRGNISGETSWLARRIGQVPEGGQAAPTPWVSSNVLALIARDGLGVSPREVELA
jgi:hypothetical protein